MEDWDADLSPCNFTTTHFLAEKKQFCHLVTSRPPIWQLALWIFISLKLRDPWNGGPFRNASSLLRSQRHATTLDLHLCKQCLEKCLFNQMAPQCHPMSAIRAPIYTSLRALRAGNPKRGSKRVALGVCKKRVALGVCKIPGKLQNTLN